MWQVAWRDAAPVEFSRSVPEQIRQERLSLDLNIASFLGLRHPLLSWREPRT